MAAVVVEGGNGGYTGRGGVDIGDEVVVVVDMGIQSYSQW